MVALHDEFKRKLHSGNAYDYLVHKLLSSHFLYRNIKVSIFRNNSVKDGNRDLWVSGTNKFKCRKPKSFESKRDKVNGNLGHIT
jgi:hypothetical protein